MSLGIEFVISPERVKVSIQSSSLNYSFQVLKRLVVGMDGVFVPFRQRLPKAILRNSCLDPVMLFCGSDDFVSERLDLGRLTPVLRTERGELVHQGFHY
jgi:hypothetical protein